MAKNLWQVITKNWLTILALLAIIVLGNKLRSFAYAEVPHPGEVADEYAYGWAGLSLIRDKLPISWSSLAPYTNRSMEKINVDNIYGVNPRIPAFPIVKPWFDHPPFFGLLTGGYAYLKGARDFSEVSVILLRRPVVKIAIITVILIFLLANHFYGTFVGILAALFYSVIPTLVISSRLALMENGIIPLFLASIFLASLYFEKKKKIFWLVAVFLGSVAMLFKISAVAILLSLILMALLYGKGRLKFLLGVSAAGVLLPLLTFIGYGALFDFKMFLAIFLANSGRFYGASSEVFYSAVTMPKVVNFFTDGWIIIAWIAAFLVSFSEWRKNKGSTIITVAVVAYLVIFIIFGSESYGWYRYPFYPFLVILLARMIQKLFVSPNLLVFLGLSLIPFGTSVHKLIGVDGFQVFVPCFRLFVAAVFAIFASSLFFKGETVKRLQQIFMILVLGFLVFLSVKEIYYYDYGRWFFAN